MESPHHRKDNAPTRHATKQSLQLLAKGVPLVNPKQHRHCHGDSSQFQMNSSSSFDLRWTSLWNQPVFALLSSKAMAGSYKPGSALVPLPVLATHSSQGATIPWLQSAMPNPSSYSAYDSVIPFGFLTSYYLTWLLQQQEDLLILNHFSGPLSFPQISDQTPSHNRQLFLLSSHRSSPVPNTQALL